MSNETKAIVIIALGAAFSGFTVAILLGSVLGWYA